VGPPLTRSTCAPAVVDELLAEGVLVDELVHELTASATAITVPRRAGVLHPRPNKIRRIIIVL
jgi:hypothetical protein